MAWFYIVSEICTTFYKKTYIDKHYNNTSEYESSTPVFKLGLVEDHSHQLVAMIKSG